MNHLDKHIYPQDLPVVILCPQCPSGTEWKKAPIHMCVISLLDHVIASGAGSFQIDPDRVYLTGISMLPTCLLRLC
jgi:predicted peptidase